MKRFFSIIIAGMSTLALADAVELVELKQDLKQSQLELDQFRKSELKRNVELAEELAKLEEELGKARHELRLVKLGQQGRKELRFSVKKEAQSYQRDFASIDAALENFALEFWLRTRRDLAAETGETQGAPDQKVEEKLRVLGRALSTLDSQIAGARLAAKVVDASGALVAGDLLEFGPLAWFQSDSKEQVGVVQFRNGKPFGKLDENVDVAAVQKLFDGEEATLMVDVTGGQARMIAKIQDNPLRVFEKGGVWIWPIVGIAVISLFCGLMKLFELRRISEPNTEWIEKLLATVRADKIDDAKEICQSTHHPVGEVIGKSLSFVSHGAQVVDEVIFEQMIGVQNKMQRWLPFIAVTAAAAPLLGLLGTVSGMIRMFNVITVTGTGDVKPMAGGISEALVTTLFGLVVAIPALVLHTMLSRRSNGIVQATERLGLSFTNGLKK